MARVVSGEPIRLHELEAEVRQAAGRLCSSQRPSVGGGALIPSSLRRHHSLNGARVSSLVAHGRAAGSDRLCGLVATSGRADGAPVVRPTQADEGDHAADRTDGNRQDVNQKRKGPRPRTRPARSEGDALAGVLESAE